MGTDTSKTIAMQSGVAGDGKVWSSGAHPDYDRDGHLDLLVTSYQAWTGENTCAGAMVRR